MEGQEGGGGNGKGHVEITMRKAMTTDVMIRKSQSNEGDGGI